MDRELRPNNIRNGLSLFMGNLSRGCCENIHRDTGAITLRDNLVLRHCYTLNGNGPSFRSNVATIRHKLPPPIYIYVYRAEIPFDFDTDRSLGRVSSHCVHTRSLLSLYLKNGLLSGYCFVLRRFDTRRYKNAIQSIPPGYVRPDVAIP